MIRIKNKLMYCVLVFVILFVILRHSYVPELQSLCDNSKWYAAYINDKNAFHKKHSQYFALNWHKFEYENISRYKYVIDNPEPDFQRTPELENKIWMLWLQGEENAPDIVKASINSVKMHANGREVIVLNKDTVKKYTKLPDYVWKKFDEGKMFASHFCDMIRLDLLYRYGGTWIDATVLLEDKIPDKILNSDVFMFHQRKGDHFSVKKYHLLENWFIQSKPNNTLIKYFLNILLEYWKYEDSQYTYLLSYSAITCIIKTNEACRLMYERMITHKANFSFYKILNKRFSNNKYKKLCNSIYSVPIYKMSYKAVPGHPRKCSIADYICRKYNVKCSHQNGYK